MFWLSHFNYEEQFILLSALQLLRLLEVFFALMEDQVALLIDTAGATATNSPVFTHQLLLQVHQQQVSPAVLEAGFDIVILVTRTYLFKENLAKPVLADLLLPGHSVTF